MTMVMRDDAGEHVSVAAVQLAGWTNAADYLERLGDVTGRPELRLLADDVRAEGEELLAPLVAHERELIAAYA
jgi:hypothetical protein